MTLIQTVIKGLLNDYGTRSVIYEVYKQSASRELADRFVSEPLFWEAMMFLTTEKLKDEGTPVRIP